MILLLYILEKPTVIINPSSPITVDEGDDVIVECKGEGGNPPADVIWYDKNNNPIGEKEKENKTLVLKNIKRENSGTYKCIAQSDTLTDEGSCIVNVNCEYSIHIRSLSLLLKGQLYEPDLLCDC